MFTFQHLEAKYGLAGAHHVLFEIEKAAQVRSSDMTSFDPEERLSYALQIQDNLLSVQQVAA